MRMQDQKHDIRSAPCFSQAASECLSDTDFYYNIEWYLNNLDSKVFGCDGTVDDFLDAQRVHKVIENDFAINPARYAPVMHLLNASRQDLQMDLLPEKVLQPLRKLELH